LGAAIRAIDLDQLRSIYADDIVSFDIEPPLRHVGVDAKLKNWSRVFTAYQGLDYEIRDLEVTVGDGVAFGSSLNRISGRLPDGHDSSYWVRWTASLCKIDGAWRIVHDHVSVPIDVGSGRALRDLEP
jgi:ketosteroid isomerase-like protein